MRPARYRGHRRVFSPSTNEAGLLDNMLRNYIVIIRDLNLAAFFWILFQKKKPDKVYYISQNISPVLLRMIKSRVAACQEKGGRPLWMTSSRFKYEHDFSNKIEHLFKALDFHDEISPVLGDLGLETDKLVESFKKYLASHVYKEFAVIQLAQGLADENHDVVVATNQNELMDGLSGGKIITKRIINPEYIFIEYLKLVYIIVKVVKKILPPMLHTASIDYNKTKIILEEIYKDEEASPEFRCFYRYLKERDDVLYICREKAETCNDLISHGKAALVMDEIPVAAHARWKEIKFFAKFIYRLARHTKLTSLIKRTIINIYYQKLLYEALFEKVKAAYFLKIRSDMLPNHPVITAVANKYGVKHIGYMHGAYAGFSHLFNKIDFHYYGTMGKAFREKFYSGAWPATIKYSVLGPFTVEAPDEIQSKEDRFIVGVFIRQTQISAGEYSYAKAIELIWTALFHLGIPNLHVLFKEHSPQAWSEEIKEGLCDKRTLSYENVYHCVKPSMPRGYAAEVIARSDIVVATSSGHSTVGFEAISKKKKVVILRPAHITPHPFEAYQLPLVVTTQKDFECSLKWLLSTPQDEYERLIQPIVDDWSKASDGNLVKDFIESIENENARSSLGNE